MYLECFREPSGDIGVVLREAGDCAKLELRNRGLTWEEIDGALQHERIGRLVDETHALLSVDTLHRRAADHRARDPEWDARWARMLELAGEMGWLSADNRHVRVHRAQPA